MVDRPKLEASMGFGVDELLAKAGESLSAGRSFGPVVEHDDCVVIPASFVIGGGGGGRGESSPPAPSPGSGSGGGFFGVSWPVGAYVVRGGEVRWVSAIDSTRLAIGVMGLAGTLLKLRAKRRASSPAA
jgi:uncharacterized spore protein YtfJ